MTATSHAANIFHRIAGNCEVRRRDQALWAMPLDPQARLQLRSLPLGGTTLFHGHLAKAQEEAKAREKAGVSKITVPRSSSSRTSSKSRPQESSGDSGRGSSSSRGCSRGGGSGRGKDQRSHSPPPKQQQQQRRQQQKSQKREQTKKDFKSKSSASNKGGHSRKP